MKYNINKNMKMYKTIMPPHPYAANTAKREQNDKKIK